MGSEFAQRPEDWLETYDERCRARFWALRPGKRIVSDEFDSVWVEEGMRPDDPKNADRVRGGVRV